MAMRDETAPASKTVIQCDFDGTVTIEDVSFAILEKFAKGDWRRFLDEYRAGKITVGGFNARAFSLVKESEKTQTDYILASPELRIRAGFPELVGYCGQHGIRFAIVSNGLEYYIKAILASMGLDHVDVHAAQSRFNSVGMEVSFTGPDGGTVDDSFKETYVQHFINEGCRVIYAGNGVSDLAPARRAHHIFATGDLAEAYRQLKLKHTPFQDFYEVRRGLEELLKANRSAKSK